MQEKIRVAIAGVGNCASALVQGVHHYTTRPVELGLMFREIGGYTPADITFVAAFDIDRRKVGMPLGEAIRQDPNCCLFFAEDLPRTGIRVLPGQQLDGVPSHMTDFPVEKRFDPIEPSEQASFDDVVTALKRSRADVLVSYMPVGSEEAATFYARACLEAGVSLINCMPVFIASRDEWAASFARKGLVIIGDDIKSQVGATIVHRVLTHLVGERGYNIKRAYQLNTGGNTDFMNMLDRSRLASKKLSKRQSVASQYAEKPPKSDDLHVGPSDYVPWQGDNKVAFIRIEAEGFGGAPLEMEMRLSVQDSPNSAGIVIDAIRFAKLALDRRQRGALVDESAYLMKSPPVQLSDSEARLRCEKIAQRDVDVEVPTEFDEAFAADVKTGNGVYVGDA